MGPHLSTCFLPEVPFWRQPHPRQRSACWSGLLVAAFDAHQAFLSSFRASWPEQLSGFYSTPSPSRFCCDASSHRFFSFPPAFVFFFKAGAVPELQLLSGQRVSYESCLFVSVGMLCWWFGWLQRCPHGGLHRWQNRLIRVVRFPDEVGNLAFFPPLHSKSSTLPDPILAYLGTSL